MASRSTADGGSSSSSDSSGDEEDPEMMRIRAAQAAAAELSSTDEDSDVAQYQASLGAPSAVQAQTKRRKKTKKKRTVALARKGARRPAAAAEDSCSDDDDSDNAGDDDSDGSGGEEDAAMKRIRARAAMADGDGASTTDENEDEDDQDDSHSHSDADEDAATKRVRARAGMGDAGDAATSSSDGEEEAEEEDDDDEEEDDEAEEDEDEAEEAAGRSSGRDGRPALKAHRSRARTQALGVASSSSEEEESSSDDDGDDNGDYSGGGAARGKVAESSQEEEEGGEGDSSEDDASSDEAAGPGADVSLEELQELKRDGKEYRLSAEGKKQVAKLKAKRFARPNKNAPRVASSKVRVSRFREVVPGKKVVRRDPRFSDVSGTLNDGYFRQSYKFLEGYQDSEIAALRKQLKMSKKLTAAQAADMQAGLTRLQQMRSSWRRRETTDAVTSEVRKANRAKIKQGRAPFFPSKRALKETAATREFQFLEKNKGKLVDTIMKKKRRKLNKHAHGQKPGRARMP